MSNNEIFRMIDESFETLRAKTIDVEFYITTGVIIKARIYEGQINDIIQAHGEFCLEININESVYIEGCGFRKQNKVWIVEPRSVIAIKIY